MPCGFYPRTHSLVHVCTQVQNTYTRPGVEAHAWIPALKRQRDILGLLGSQQSILSGFRPMREPVSKIKLGTREMVPRVFATKPGDLIWAPRTHMMDKQK